MSADDEAVGGRSPSQTLSRGIRMLEVLAESGAALTIAELAEALEVHRSIAYRILRTLEDHGLVVRDGAGRAALGPRMAALARGVARDLQTAALPELTVLANDLQMTAFLVVLDHSECVTLVSVEPRHSGATLAQRPGTRHPLSVGAPGLAIQSRLSPAQWAAYAPGLAPRAETAAVSAVGYAESHDEVIAGLSSIAAPIDVAGGPPAAVAVVFVSTAASGSQIGERVRSAAAAIGRELG